jgi:hypothetical protein
MIRRHSALHPKGQVAALVRVGMTKPAKASFSRSTPRSLPERRQRLVSDAVDDASGNEVFPRLRRLLIRRFASPCFSGSDPSGSRPPSGPPRSILYALVRRRSPRWLPPAAPDRIRQGGRPGTCAPNLDRVRKRPIMTLSLWLFIINFRRLTALYTLVCAR